MFDSYLKYRMIQVNIDICNCEILPLGLLPNEINCTAPEKAKNITTTKQISNKNVSNSKDLKMSWAWVF